MNFLCSYQKTFDDLLPLPLPPCLSRAAIVTCPLLRLGSLSFLLLNPDYPALVKYATASMLHVVGKCEFFSHYNFLCRGCNE